MNFVELAERIGGICAVRTNVNYHQLSTLGAGGRAALVAEPADDAELAALLKTAWDAQIPVMAIGGGSNLVGADRPYEGILLRLKGEFTQITIGADGRVVAGAGASLGELVRRAAEAGWGGLTALSGIPGSVGGALRMNAGANGGSAGAWVRTVRGFDLRGQAVSLPGSGIRWGYRESSLDDGVIVTAAELVLQESTPEREIAQRAALLAARRDREPAGRTAGCVFRNPGSMDSAGKLIDEAGLKNSVFGAIVVSAEHANYLMNRGGASEADMLEAMIAVRRTVAEKTGIYLEPEVKFVDPTTREKLFDAVPAPHVAVLMGGNSSEREVSLRSGAAVAQALRSAGCRVTEFDIERCELPEAATRCDVVFPVLHGGFGEGGEIQKIMSAMALPYVGTESAPSARILDKIATKRLLAQLQMPTAPWFVVRDSAAPFPEDWRFPVVVKVPCEGSTVGIERVQCAADWRPTLEKLLASAPELLVESFIAGRECTVPVLLGAATPVIEIRPPGGFYDYDAKYVYAHGHTQYFCPPETITAAEQTQLRLLAEQFYREFECRDMVRVDFILGADGTPYILEGNTIPGFTATSLVPKAAAAMGVSFARLTAGLVRAALNR